MLVVISLMLVIVCIFLDQITKSYARYSLLKEKKINVTEVGKTDEKLKSTKVPFFNFALVKNKGAFRGLFKQNPVLLIVVQGAGIVAIGIMLLIQMITKKDKLLVLGLSLIFGGAIGNLIDRLKDGYVTDFFAIRWTKNLYYNLADWFIFVGALITFLRSKNL